MTQSRLETYLASSSRADFDIAQQVDRETSHRANSHTNGTETPKDLASQLRIVELFALHVLPRNEEWEYARSFISMSDMLDDERRETFLQSLQELKDVREYEMKEQASILEHESDLPVQELSEVKNQIEAKNSTPKPSAAEQSGRGHQRTSSEVDYGIEKKQPNSNSLPGPKTEKPVTRASKVTPAAVSSGLYSSSSAGISRNGKVRKPSQKQSPAYLQQVRNLFRVMQNLVRNMATAIGANPTVLLQMLLSALAIIMAFSRRDIRERANRVLANGWNRVRGTVRMGVKVSYI